jgi:hypothetical protein
LNKREELQKEEEEYRHRRLQEDADYINLRRREADMLCSSPKVGAEGSTMAETKKTPNISKDGPVKAYDLPRQIEETSSHN